ncbi:hypothetical protein DB032_20505 [Chromobacterium sp. Panama]|uniref:DUF3396 domain-containing protein n=1 Tax=Chromobacterium sp. Panama TaxID=2161826 RepID=UPI000D30C8C2|nr:DUF3396 domain-containing protein [Chromobacterium sp. Panama]PTU67137.1 hypothetical protein DB032_20505 [Chromobacterium sp. Panama]
MGDVQIETVAQLQAHLKQLLSLDDDSFTATGTQTICFVDMPVKKLLALFKDRQGPLGWEKVGMEWAYSNKERNVSFYIRGVGSNSLLISTVMTLHNKYLTRFGGGVVDENINEQQLRYLNAYGCILNQADYIDGVSPEGEALVKLGLICTVYFRNGGQRDVGYKVLGCFDRFVEQFGEYLQGQFHSLSGRSFTSLRKDSIVKAKEKLRELVDKGAMFSWILQSEKTAEVAASYSISALTSNAESDSYGAMSCVKIMLPWQLLEDEDGEQRFKDWACYLCENLDVEHGYAGLACNLPYDYHQFQPYEFQMAQRYSGLMVDSFALIDGGNLSEHIKGVNWLTLLGPRYIEQLGGMAALKQQLQLPDVSVQETDNGRLMVQAGVLPDVGAQEDGHPPAYVAVNRVLKSIRVPNPDQLHSCMDDAEGFTKANTLAWYARFDDATPVASLSPSAPAGELWRKAGQASPIPSDQMMRDAQAPSHKQAYARIAKQVDFIEGVTPEGQVLVRLGLMCTVYFRNGGQRDMGYKVLGCFDRFVEQFGPHLKGQFHDFSGRGFTSLRKASITKAKEKLSGLVDDGAMFFWILQSEKNGELPAEYAIKAMTCNIDHDSEWLSYLKITLPWQLLEEPDGEQQFKDWVRYLCETLDVDQGYAGLACNLPYDYHQFQPYEFQMAQRYSGLMVDSASYLDKAALEDGIKGVNWLTLLGPRYIEQLGGMAVLKQQLQLPDVSVQETDNGRLMIQAGVLPDVGAQEDGHPPAYVAVNRVLKRVRVPHPDQLHTCMDDAEGFTKANTLAWYARFDDATPVLSPPSPAPAGA